MSLKSRLRATLEARHPALWRALDSFYIQTIARRGASPMNQIELRSAPVGRNTTSPYVMMPGDVAVGRTAMWRRLRTLEPAMDRADARSLAGAWPEPPDTLAAGPLFRREWAPGGVDHWRDAMDEAYRRGGWLAGRTPERYQPDVLFIPHNAYHTDEMARVAAELRDRKQRTLFCDVTDHYHDEGARDRMRSLGLAHTPYAWDMLPRLRPGAVLVMNDWSGPPHQAVIDARSLGIPTLALVEGVQDYADTHLPDDQAHARRHPYHHADTALLVGDFDRRFFPDHPCEVTGSTRIEALAREPRPVHRRRRAVINSNFTYGVHTDDAPAWIAAATAACREAGVEYVVSRHRADTVDLAGHPVSDLPLYDELREAGVLISRFSGVILEAMALDTPVIYFNPHAERMATFLDVEDAFPSPATQADLASAIRQTIDADASAVAARQRPFFENRVSIDPERPSPVRIAEAIERRLAPR